MRLQGMELSSVIGQSENQDQFTSLVIRAWNMMKGLDWAALPSVVEVLDVDDVVSLVTGLLEVRNWMDATEQMERNS